MVKDNRAADPILALVALGWLLGTPVLLYKALILAAPFFGETPSPEEMHDAAVLLFAGLACGLVLPTAGIVVAAVTGRRAAARLFAVALALTIGLLAYVATR
jgi:hypothetical protein